MFTFLFFFFNDTATTEIYTLSLHDALPILIEKVSGKSYYDYVAENIYKAANMTNSGSEPESVEVRSEEHTSELQSLTNLVCRLLLEKKKKKNTEKHKHEDNNVT